MDIGGETESGAQRMAGRAVGRRDPAARADEDGWQVPADDPRENAGVQVEVGGDRGGVAVVGELLDQHALDAVPRPVEARALTALVAAGGHREVAVRPTAVSWPVASKIARWATWPGIA